MLEVMATPAAKKRKLEDCIHAKVEEALLKREQIRSFKPDFGNGLAKQRLVFPGLDSCRVQRPPKEFDYCGRKQYREISRQIQMALDDEQRVFLLTGPEGSGKSCILRALGMELLRFQMWNQERLRIPAFRLVCLWSKQSLREQVQEAFLFAFSDNEEAVNQISRIETWKEAAGFLQERKTLGERIWLITDGEERLDFSNDPRDEKLREAARTWLTEISREADFIIKALSPGASELAESPLQASPSRYILDRMLDTVERDTFIRDTALEANLLVYPERWDTVDEIAGCHPLSLSLLINYCNRAIGFFPRRQALGSVARAFLEFKNDGAAAPAGPLPAPDPIAASDPSASSVTLPDPLMDEIVWAQLVQFFKQDAIFKHMREAVRKADIRTNELASFRSLAAKFPAYVANGEFCTPLIRKIYMEEASSRLLSRAYASQAWLNYVKERLRDERGLNWAELGWLCKNFMGQVVQSKGLKLAEEVGKPVKHFRGIQVKHLEGTEPETQETCNWKDGMAVLLLPDKYFFKYVDFVLVLKIQGVVHVYGGQVAGDPGSHRKTEKRFVKASNIKRWVADAACRVHYAYLCPSRASTSFREVDCKSQDGEEYVLHTTSFSECFQDIGVEETELLKQLAWKRKETMDKRKAAKKDAAAKRSAKMDPVVRRYMKWTDVKYLKEKGLVHAISFKGVTKEAMVKQLMEADKMESCGGDGESCPSCCLLARQLGERKKPKL